MVKQDEKLPELELVLKDSPFEEALECVKRVYASVGINTVYELENSPRSLTCSFCGISTHKLIQHILNWMANPPVQEEPKPEPDPVLELVEDDKESVEEAPKQPVKRQRKSIGGTSSPRKKE